MRWLNLIDESQPISEAVRDGLLSLAPKGDSSVDFGVQSLWREWEDHGEYDGIILRGLRGNAANAAKLYSKLEKPVLIVDPPHIRTGSQHRLTPPDHAWLPKFLCPSDRLAKLNVTVAEKPKKRGEGFILLLGQVGGDSAHNMSSSQVFDWAEQAIKRIRKHTDCEIIWRPHPQEKSDRMLKAEYISVNEPLADALAESWAAVTLNSTAGFEALCAGLCVFTDVPAFYGSLTCRLEEFEKAKPPEAGDVEKLLALVSYTQWAIEELATSIPYEIALSDILGKPGWLDKIEESEATLDSPIEPFAGTPESELPFAGTLEDEQPSTGVRESEIETNLPDIDTMKPRELREWYSEAFGEPTPSRAGRPWVTKRLREKGLLDG